VYNKRSNGQAPTEFIIVIPVLILLIFGSIQIAFIYSAKPTLNYATFQAARLAAVNHASYGSLRRGLIRGLAPLYTTSNDLDGVKTDIIEGAFNTSGKRNAQGEVDHYTRIIRITPNTAAFQSGSGGFGKLNSDGVLEIPNDNLMYRSAKTNSEGINIQDSNLLKIRVQYCYKLMVPLVNRIIGSLSELNNTRKLSDYHIHDTVTDPHFSDRNRGAANEAGSLSASLGSYDELCGASGDDRASNNTGFVITSEAIVRMQSAAREEGPEFSTQMCDGRHMACP
jgi:hypothetical protein